MIRAWFLLLLCVLYLNGCALAPTVVPTRLFVLTPLAVADGAHQAKTDLIVGPVELPAYTERPQMLVLQGETELIPLRDARWAEPLTKNVERVMAENLSRLMGAHVTLLGGASAPGALQVTVAFSDIVATDSGDVRVIASWRVLGDGGRVQRASGKTQIELAASVSDGSSYAQALSRALADLSTKLADAVIGAPK